MSGALIHSTDETIRETLKVALTYHLPLIITEDLPQCLDVLRHKTLLKTAFIGISEDNEDPGPEIFKEIAALRPGLRTIAVGTHNSEHLAVDAVRHGASGYIILPVKAGELLALAQPAA